MAEAIAKHMHACMHAQQGRLPSGHDALRVVRGGVARHTELHIITLHQLGVRNVLQLGAVKEEVLRALAGPDEAPALLALPMHLLHLHSVLQIHIWHPKRCLLEMRKARDQEPTQPNRAFTSATLMLWQLIVLCLTLTRYRVRLMTDLAQLALVLSLAQELDALSNAGAQLAVEED